MGSPVQVAAAAAIVPQERLARGPRTAMAAVACGCTALLGVAAWLEPAARGIGTHTQLGLPACSWPATMGIPCPSCGMTTAFALAADGHLLDSLRAQPLGMLLAVATAAVAIASAHSAVTGARTLSILGSMIGPRVWWSLGGLALGAWAFKALSMRGIL